MITNGVTIEWDVSTEYIEIDFDNLADLKEITSTLEWWGSEKKFVQYKTISTVEYLTNGIVELRIEYKHELNPHIGHDDAMWGTSILTLIPSESKGDAKWIGAETSEGDGVVTWQRLAVDLVSKKGRKTVSQLERKQQMFRNALFTFEPKCCAISGEQTKAVLEAAHIIPAKDGGAEVVENGILLRADIHRLYDAGCFSIDLSGAIVNIKDDVSPEYLKVLQNARISDKTLDRVKKALKYQLEKVSN